jgi:hypothetical protein
MQLEIWMGTVEINVAGSESPDAMRRAFTVITTWASSYDEFSRKTRQMVESHGWKLLSVERASPVPDDRVFSNDVEDMLERTRENREAIVYGTFHSYLR